MVGPPCGVTGPQVSEGCCPSGVWSVLNLMEGSCHYTILS